MKPIRNTRQRQLVLDIAKQHKDHPTADQLYLEVRAIDEKISRGTVYRNLNQLVALGELMHVKVPSADRFDIRLERHYHLFCTECGAVCDAPMDYVADNDERMAAETGFKIERHRMVFEGICPECQKKHVS